MGDSQLKFTIERDDFDEGYVEETYDLIVRLISDFDSTGNLFVGGEQSVKSLLEDEGVEEGILRSVEGVDDILDSGIMEDIEDFRDCYISYLKGEHDNFGDFYKKICSVKRDLERATEKYRSEVYDELDEKNKNNVKYALSYLIKLVQISKEIEDRIVS